MSLDTAQESSFNALPDVTIDQLNTLTNSYINYLRLVTPVPENVNDLPFKPSPLWHPHSGEINSHHEPLLDQLSHPLVDLALEVKQGTTIGLTQQDTTRYLKSWGVGPCIVLTTSNPEISALGSIHFQAGDNIFDLQDELKDKLHTQNFEGFTTTLLGGIRDDKGSQSLYKAITENWNHPIHADHAMKFSMQPFLNSGWEMDDVMQFGFQNIIMDKMTGNILSFNPRSFLIKKI